MFFIFLFNIQYSIIRHIKKIGYDIYEFAQSSSSLWIESFSSSGCLIIESMCNFYFYLFARSDVWFMRNISIEFFFVCVCFAKLILYFCQCRRFLLCMCVCICLVCLFCIFLFIIIFTQLFSIVSLWRFYSKKKFQFIQIICMIYSVWCIFEYLKFISFHFISFVPQHTSHHFFISHYLCMCVYVFVICIIFEGMNVLDIHCATKKKK